MFSRIDRVRPLVVSVVVSVIGIVAAVAIYQSYRSQAEADAYRSLSDAGEELARVAVDLEQVATEQALGIRGLFESSADVTEAEFDHFASVIGEPVENTLSYAPRVPAADIDAFLTETRTVMPSYYLRYLGPEDPGSRDAIWPLLYTSRRSSVGFLPGFDFGSDATINEAIDAAAAGEGPVATGFVNVPGDDDEGDLLIVSVISKDGVPAGIAVVTLQLDELLNARVEKLLGSSASLEMTQLTPGSAVPATPEGAWQTTLDLTGQQIVLLVTPIGVTGSGLSAAGLVLLLGVFISLALGWLTHLVWRRHSMTLELTALQQSLAEKDRFLASVSHELRTPLTSVVGALEILTDDRIPLDEKERRTIVEDAAESALELEKLVEDHLTAARLSAGALTIKSEPVRLDAVVHRILSTLNLPPRITVRLGELGSCRGDQLRVRQIIRNIVRNAARHAATEIEIRSRMVGELVVVEILNDGDPVAPQIADRLFQPFVGLGAPGQPESIGLGLSISRDLAIRMGGDLTYSFDGSRVCFGLSLPVLVEEADESLDDGVAASL